MRKKAGRQLAGRQWELVDWSIVPDTFEFPFVKYAQKCNLSLSRKISDLIKERSATFRRFEPAGVRP